MLHIMKLCNFYANLNVKKDLVPKKKIHSNIFTYLIFVICTFYTAIDH